MTFAVCLTSTSPWRFVINTQTARSAQIAARLLAERFPGMDFDYLAGPDIEHGDCHPSIRDCATSFEVERLIDVELVLEKSVNPDGHSKWIVFRDRNGGVTAWPDHALREIEACRRDDNEIDERSLYAAHAPSPNELFDLFRSPRSTYPGR